jgi:hypothetical protein
MVSASQKPQFHLLDSPVSGMETAPDEQVERSRARQI